MSFGQKTWSHQPNTTLDAKNNITYSDNNEEVKKTIFPVMLYSFNGWEESSNDKFWKEIHRWGINIVYSWDINRADKFLNYANKYNTLVLLDHQSAIKNKPFVSFPDEPIGAGTATFNELKKINANLNSSSLKFINVDVGPYYYRKKYDKASKNFFKSQFNCKWCAHGKGSQLSYNQSVEFAQIISFDYYPFGTNGKINKNVDQYGETSVGEFTRMLKRQYPNKSIWAVIQTMWFNPFNDSYRGNIITSKVIRNLSFDAIINGADGLSFFGHGQTIEYSKKKDYEFLKNLDTRIWKYTLFQTFELGQLQENYDKILLEDNFFQYTDSKLGYSFAIKKVPNKNKYYVFVVNHLETKNKINLKIPKALKITDLNSIHVVGRYTTPELYGISKEQVLDYTKEIKFSSLGDNTLKLELDSYSVGIFCF